MVGTDPNPRTDAEPLSIAPRRSLPGGRAVVGGLLVATAAVGSFAVASGSDPGPTGRFVVARHDLAPGHVVQATDVTVSAGDLPDALLARSYRTAAPVVGSIVLGPVRRGELVQPGNLRSDPPPAPVVTLTLDPAGAVGGDLQPGDRVDAYVSYGAGTTSSTRRVVVGALVVRVHQGDDAIGASGEVRVTLAVEQADRRIDLVNAAHAGQVTLARAGGAPPSATGADLFVEQERNGESGAQPPAGTGAAP